MAYSQITVPGDGVTTLIPVSFALGFIEEGNVTCRVGDEATDREITFSTPTLIQVSGAPAALGENYVFTRNVSADSLIVDWDDGNPITGTNLNLAQKQGIMLTHQALDSLDRALKVPAGQTGGVITVGPAGSVPLWGADGGLTSGGPTAADIVSAQSYAEAAQGYTETAQSYAEAAQGHTETAQSYAEAAQGHTETAAASFEDFDSRYLGPKAIAPVVDNAGEALLTGALYWDTVLEALQLWSGSAWLPLADSGVTYNSITNDKLDNTDQFVFSINGWDPQTDRVYGRSTPETARVAIGGHYDEWGAAGRNYLWGLSGWMTNGDTAPITVIDTVAQGWKVRGMGATVRQVGAGGDGHALEILSGQYNAAARFTTVSGSTTLTRTAAILKGSRFTIGDRIIGAVGTAAAPGSGIQASTFVTALTKGGVVSTGYHVDNAVTSATGTGWVVGDRLRTASSDTRLRYAELEVRTVSGGSPTSYLVIDPGDYSAAPSGPVGVIKVGGGATGGLSIDLELIPAGVANPDTITMSKAALTSGSSVQLEFLPATAAGNAMNIGILVTGSGDGGNDATGNPNGRAIQVQSYGNAAYYKGLVFGASSTRTDGTAIELAAVNAAYGIHVTGGSFSTAALRVGDGVSIFGRGTVDTSGVSNEAGVSILTSGLVAATRDGFQALSLNRTGSDGVIAILRRSGATSGSITVTGSSAAFNTTSDETFKHFIGDYSPDKAIDIIRRDPVREFHWDEAHGGGHAVGWGAQHSHAVSPDLAAKGGWRDPLTGNEWVAGGVRWINPITQGDAKDGEVFCVDELTQEPAQENSVRWVDPRDSTKAAYEGQSFHVEVADGVWETVPARRVASKMVHAERIEAEYLPWGVDQSKRAPYLWAAVSGLLDRIDELERRINILTDRASS